MLIKKYSFYLKKNISYKKLMVKILKNIFIKISIFNEFKMSDYIHPLKKGFELRKVVKGFVPYVIRYDKCYIDSTNTKYYLFKYDNNFWISTETNYFHDRFSPDFKVDNPYSLNNLNDPKFFLQNNIKLKTYKTIDFERIINTIIAIIFMFFFLYLFILYLFVSIF
jgi:hypothetical protein